MIRPGLYILLFVWFCYSDLFSQDVLFSQHYNNLIYNNAAFTGVFNGQGDFAGGATGEGIGGHADHQGAVGNADGLVTGDLDQLAFGGDLDTDLGLRGAGKFGVATDNHRDQLGLIRREREWR